MTDESICDRIRNYVLDCLRTSSSDLCFVLGEEIEAREKAKSKHRFLIFCSYYR